MQVQDEDDEEVVPVTPTKSSPEATPVKESPAASDWKKHSTQLSFTHVQLSPQDFRISKENQVTLFIT